MKRRGLLIDRDGTICEEVGYLDRVEALKLLPGSAKAIRRANEAGFQAVVITNQSGVGRGLLDESRLADIHDGMRALLAEEGARIDGIYYCPHHPAAALDRYRRECECRKPRPGMLLRAGDEMGIDLKASYVIGDRCRDVEAARAVGATDVLVLTGYGSREVEYHSGRERPRPTHVAKDLGAAVDWILNREAQRAADD